MSDASTVAVGAMLAQIWEGYEQPIAYFSKALTPTQRNWHPFELETYACLLALRAFRHYITACDFVIVTDCRALAHFNTTREVSAKIVRWLSELSQHKAQFVHRMGVFNVIPDWQSRDCKHLNSYDRDDFEKHLEYGVHSAPLKYFSQKEGVGSKINKNSQPDNPKYIINTLKNTSNQITISKILEEQLANRFCQQICNFFVKGITPKSQEGKKAFMEKIKGFTVHNGMVYKIPMERDIRHPPLPFVSNYNTRKLIISQYHDDPDHAHPGQYRMKQRIIRSFWWQTLDVDVANYCKNCKSCHKVKPQKTSKPMGKSIKHYGAWECISLDHVGRFPKTTREYTHILVIIDRFTRWVEMVPIKGDTNNGGLSSKTTLYKYTKRIVDRFGAPKKVITDGSTSFEGEFHDYLVKNNTKHRKGQPYQHTTNGMAERMIGGIEIAIRHYVGPDLNDWDQYLSKIQASINSHLTNGPKNSPFYLNMGRERRDNLENVLLEPIDDLSSEDKEEFSIDREIIQKEINIRTEEENLKSQKKMEKIMERKQSKKQWIPVVGQWVMVKRPKETVSSKLEPLYDGPFKVVSISKYGNYDLASPLEEHAQYTVPRERLSRYREMNPLNVERYQANGLT